MLPGLWLRRFHGSSNCYCKDNVPSSPRTPIPAGGGCPDYALILPKLPPWVFIESCIINVLFQAQRKRTVLDEGAQQIFVVLQGARGVACQIRELINFVNGAIG